MTNYSPLQQNTLHGLSETAGILYLKLCDTLQAHNGGEVKAFLAADAYDRRVGNTLDCILRNAPNAPDENTRRELSQFFAERWRHNFMVAA